MDLQPLKDAKKKSDAFLIREANKIKYDLPPNLSPKLQI